VHDGACILSCVVYGMAGQTYDITACDACMQNIFLVYGTALIWMWMQVQDVLDCSQAAGQLYWDTFSIIWYMIFAKQANENLLPAGTTLISRISDYATNQYGPIAMQIGNTITPHCPAVPNRRIPFSLQRPLPIPSPIPHLGCLDPVRHMALYSGHLMADDLRCFLMADST
jgi:hypothetical protein